MLRGRVHQFDAIVNPAGKSFFGAPGTPDASLVAIERFSPARESHAFAVRDHSGSLPPPCEICTGAADWSKPLQEYFRGDTRSAGVSEPRPSGEASECDRPKPSRRGGAVSQTPRAIAFDGVNICVANSHNNTVAKVSAAEFGVLGTYYAGIAPGAVVFDDDGIWVANSHSNAVGKM